MMRVTDCIARDLIKPQLTATVGLSDAVVTLIEMSDVATVVFERAAVDEDLLKVLEKRKHARAQSHGNYIPALKSVKELLIKEDYASNGQLFLLFLSDGAPSDHTEMYCDCGVQVWRPDPLDSRLFKGKPRLADCGGRQQTTQCRKELVMRVQDKCCSILQQLGELFGRDRMFVVGLRVLGTFLTMVCA
jgi:hypothetical protein